MLGWMTVWPAGFHPCCLPRPRWGGGGCSELGRCQGAPPRYERGGPHTMVVSSELQSTEVCTIAISSSTCICTVDSTHTHTMVMTLGIVILKKIKLLCVLHF